MTINAAHWTVTRSSGNIRYIGPDHQVGGETYATVIELHRWLQDLADDAAYSGDDQLDIVDATPSNRSTDNIITLVNGFNIDDIAAEHLYDGSVIQGTVGVDQVIYDGIVNFGNADVQIQIHQNGAVLSDDWWNQNSAGLNPDATAGISHRFMIKVHDYVADGGDIDSRHLLGTCRRWNKTYSEFNISATSRGNNVLALVDATDLNNSNTTGNVATWTSIVNDTQGFVLLDVDNDGTDEEYYSEWNEGVGGETGRAGTINDIYERLKYDTRDGSAATLYGLNGELFRGITHQVDLNTAGSNSGTFSAFEAISYTGGTAQMLAIESTTAATADRMWIQVLTGSAPGDGVLITGGGSLATATTAASSASTAHTISTPFCGSSTGSNLIGSYGLGIKLTDLGASDLLTDLSGTTKQPPNTVTFTVSGLVSGEDYVLVGTDASSAFNLNQYTLNGALIGAAVTSVVVTGSIDSETPLSGTIRVQRDSGLISRHAYSSWTGSTFTITSHDFSTDNASTANEVMTSFIDVLASGTTESFSYIYSADRTLFIRVRDGGTAGDAEGIKTFETTGTLGSGGGSATVIRTSDV